MQLKRVFPRLFLKALMRLFPFYRGGVRIAQSKLFKKLTSTDELLITRLRTGPYIMVNLNDYIGRSIYYWGDYDRKITYTCMRLLEKGDCFLDIGANVAEVGLSAARVVGPSGQVHVFEPQVQICDYIRKSVNRNQFTNLHIHEVALSDQDNECLMSVPHDNSGAGALSFGINDMARLIRVTTCQATKYLSQLNLPQIKAIKMDVEDHEGTLLKGAYDFLDFNKPVAIIFESHENRIPFFNRCEVKILTDLGYSIFQIRQRPLVNVNFREVTSNEMETGYDFVALLKSELNYYSNIFSFV